jgi:hypothetical protein
MHFYLANFYMAVLLQDNLEIHRAGFKSSSMHNLSDLVQQAVATNVCKLLTFTILLGEKLEFLYVIKLHLHTMPTNVDFL